MIEVKKQHNYFKVVSSVITIVVTLAMIAFIIYGIKEGIFSSDKKMIHSIQKMGVLAPLLFIAIQVVQVVFPVIPGGASCLVGVIAFGPLWGFIYNYIGLCIGSLLAFFLSRKCGMKIIRKLFKEKTTQKYMKYTKQQKFDKIFFWGILIPGAPDDLLCYIAGLTKMTVGTFILVITLAKPLTLIGYSIGIDILPSFF